MTVPLRWQPSPLLHTLATLGLVGLLTAAVLHSATAVAMVTPELLWLAWFARPALPRSVEADVDCHPRLCEEGDEVSVRLTAALPSEDLRADADCFGAEPDMEGTRFDGGTRRWAWRARARHWGGGPIARGTLRLTSRGGLWVAHLPVSWPDVEVWPRSGHVGQTVRSPRVRPWPGSRPARATGPGTEPVGVSPYSPGVSVRRVNWRRTVQRQEWYVTEFAVERAQDVVLVVDATVEAGPAGDTTVDRGVRGAAAMAGAHIEAGDRVGLVTITPMIDWVVPGLGRRHLARVLHALSGLTGWESEVPPNLDRLPRAAVPRGSLVILFSPLLSEQSVGLVGDLRRRGHPVLLVEVSPTDPRVEGDKRFGATAVRLWRLEREATLLALQDRGVRVLRWPQGSDLAVQVAEHLNDRALREVVA